jgi:hypothetical protein
MTPIDETRAMAFGGVVISYSDPCLPIAPEVHTVPAIMIKFISAAVS